MSLQESILKDIVGTPVLWTSESGVRTYGEVTAVHQSHLRGCEPFFECHFGAEIRHVLHFRLDPGVGFQLLSKHIKPVSL